jgi:hypothetical protein
MQKYTNSIDNIDIFVKKFFMPKITLLLFVLFNAFHHFSFAQYYIDFQIRPRLELRDGYQKLQQKDAIPAILTTQRTRLTMSYETDNLKIILSPQDIRIWGDEQLANMTAVYGDYASFDMFEGFVEAKVKNNTWVSVGRQQLVYDNEWLLAARNWNQHGNSIDAFVLKTKPKNMNLHIGLAWNTFKENRQNNFFPSDRVKSLNFLWLNKKFSEKNQLSFMYLSTGITRNDTSNVLYYRHTSGIFAEHKSDNFFASANGYYQFGVNNKGKKVSAFLSFADIRYIKEKFFVGSSISYLSGNNNVEQDMTTDNLFDNIYGGRHRYFGFLDYFRNFANDTKQAGLVDYAFTLDFKLNKKISIRNISHYFMLAQTNSLSGGNQKLGFENDLIIKHKVYDWGELEFGHCFFLPTETMKILHNISDNKFSQFVYIQFTVKTSIFKS